MFTFSLIIGYFISKIISKPIEELSLAAKKIGKGNFDASFKIETELDEINELSSTLEKAKDELSRTDELRRDLMANVGHDLKTPLTMIKAYAEMTRDFENQPQEKKKENLNIIIEETNRLTRLVNDIVDLSKLQSNVYELKLEETDLNQLIKDIIKRYNVFVENEGYNLEYNLKDNTDEYKVLIDKNKIEQVIYNLINNAVNYTGNDKNIFVELLNEKKKYVVKIKDTGKGIKPEEIDKIWDKYYHNNKKHKRNSIGTGLGLSIVKNILEIHKFKYGVSTKKDKGTTFFFEISKKK
jgi:signal transduction histidine kinase